MPATGRAGLLHTSRVVGLERSPALETRAYLIGQIKKPKFTCGTLSPRGTGQARSDASLYDVEGSGRRLFRGEPAKLVSLTATYVAWSWWSRSGSNRRPEACKATALPTELRPQNSAVGSRQSAVVPRRRCHSTADCPLPTAQELVGPGRLELPTLRLSGVRSNHLSYGPLWNTPGEPRSQVR
jgi:hypothetical protein